MYPKFVNALRKNYTSEATRWFANARDGEAVVITYSFMSRDPEQPRVYPLVSIGDTFARYNAAEKKVIKNSLKAWSSVANIRFVEVPAQNADIMFGKYNMPYKVNGHAGRLNYTYENGTLNPTDIWLDRDGFLKTRYGQEVATHEIGHTLGLEHPLWGRGGLKAEEFGTSVMAFDLWGEPPYTGYPTKLGVIDAAAVQSIYGPAQRKLGANVYKVGKTKLIWDGGGSDTISAAWAKAKAHIDLNDGSWNWVGKKASSILAKDQSWVGHFTQIENAVGSKYADTIIGNELDNVIDGGRGNDTITGGEGADILTGGPGNDTFVFRSFEEMGTMDRHDRVEDFELGDKIDLRKLSSVFLGNGDSNSLLKSGQAVQFYFNTKSQKLCFDVNGDGIPEFFIGVKIENMKSEFFQL
ncbi:M10 family metallopeptidase C-terminal domain-containing protein [Microvirga flavescens]|uniref:M10 family metallopeptidase C-terminal domain-containing protein n=1 Tax=Microvirga flavescens TaxID=2249811 RepID=UPI000DD96146|nr:M10 family metallopeptidase C-terminal domain-containing protein [Microvirga flavescens]